VEGADSAKPAPAPSTRVSQRRITTGGVCGPYVVARLMAWFINVKEPPPALL